MLEISNLTKRFGKFTAVSDMNISIKEGTIVGLIGSNGAGKSTIIRMLCGIYKPDEGTVLYDDNTVYDNVDTKRDLFYFPDELYFPGTTVSDTGKFYRHFYPNFNMTFFTELCDSFGLRKKAPIITLSKGMKRQVMMNAAIASGVKYIYLDEAFDGLDAVARQTYIRLLIELSREKKTVVIVATHNIREIDNFCDELCLMYKSSIIAHTTPEDLVARRSRAIVIFDDDETVDSLPAGSLVNHFAKDDKTTLTFDMPKKQAEELIKTIKTKSVEFIPLTLEDAFVCELEVSGYAVKKIDVM